MASSEKAIRELGWKPRYTQLDEIVRTAWIWHQKRYARSSIGRIGTMAISRQQALDYFHSPDLIGLGFEADQVRRRLHPEGVVTYIIDRNINYTNFCTEYCTFGAFTVRCPAPASRIRAATRATSSTSRRSTRKSPRPSRAERAC